MQDQYEGGWHDEICGQSKQEENCPEEENDCTGKAIEPQENRCQESSHRCEEEPFIATCLEGDSQSRAIHLSRRYFLRTRATFQKRTAFGIGGAVG